ncbi:hypothetical protein BpHYR1_010512 [Brachionus plicatilis]|uniref:Uncharacterized protein n=1 Tax=Brachionus plicatilis TaxID=10195 RepID=A0A3M7TAE5_BRAPC|nr:hypothetical protein BpHYR1_010512 [Brachionus plicatilis]
MDIFFKQYPTTVCLIYKSLIGSIIDYSFPCLNTFGDNNTKQLLSEYKPGIITYLLNREQ